MEKEVSGKLPFLDSLVIRMPERVKTNVYRKPTHSDRYIHFSSHHPRAVMKGVIRGMARRAIDLCEPEFLEAELDHIYKTFKENGYPSSLVHSVIQQALANPHRTQNTVTSGPRILLPYYKGLSERIQRLGRTLDFSRGPNLRSLLRSDKVRLPLDEHSCVVYEVKCSCSATYIGKTGFTLAHRFLQHMRHLTRYNNAKRELEETSSTTTRRGRPPSVLPLVAMERALAASAVAEHATLCSGSLQTRILCKEPHLSLRRTKEALFIQHNTNINRDKGAEISDIWNNLINVTKCCLLD
ncbi:hypothetical protein M514_08438 [Trichuris suis]|uniref:Helix-turn-helix domain-containing protein n=1 Tax=Trichuris suis TaxID=68888 RepID=A0A085MV03_9BILA|nr:hypothetical protein M514_08438 [Trichuris suis]